MSVYAGVGSDGPHARGGRMTSPPMTGGRGAEPPCSSGSTKDETNK